MKRRWIAAIAVLLFLLVLLVPVPIRLKDGGTVEYKALLYKVSKIHSLVSEDEMEKAEKAEPYKKGTIVEVLGVEIFNSVE